MSAHMFKQKARTQDNSALCERIETIDAVLPELRSYARSLTDNAVQADQLVEHCTVLAVERLSRGAAKNDLREWLFATLRNVHRSEFRHPHELLTETDLSAPSEPASALIEPDISQSDLNSLSHAFGRLAAEEQDLLIQVVVEGASYEDIATAFGITPDEVRTRVSLARRTLKENMLREVR